MPRFGHYSEGVPVTPAATVAALMAVAALTAAGCGSSSHPRAARATAPPAVTTTVAAPDATSAPTTAATTGTTTASTTTVAAPVPEAAPTTSAVTSAARTLAVGDCVHASYEPTSITLACADGGVVAADIAWSVWTSTTAVGTGTAIVNSCTPDCAEGSPQRFAARITLSGLRTVDGTPEFSSATLVATGTAPPGDQRFTYPLMAAPA
jgi:hypothetical protein